MDKSIFCAKTKYKMTWISTGISLDIISELWENNDYENYTNTTDGE